MATSTVRAQPARVRWDRLARGAMLIVSLVMLYLYIGPARSLLSTLSEASRRDHAVSTLQRENLQLKARRDALQQASTLEQRARGLGLVKPGEREYVISGLPSN
ncbi:MAG: hypothetical protein NVSMB51_16310 [Solirubrobacteraceae bacterium]